MIVRLLVFTMLIATPAVAAMQQGKPAPVEDVWKPAATPKGGVSWSILGATKETTRKDAKGYIRSKPVFTPQVMALSGKRIRVAGYMTPLEPGSRQSRFVLLAYPPGCPFHMHAMPWQFIEVRAATPFPLNETKPHIVEGTLELTGYDEGGIFYRLNASKPG